MHLIAYRQTAQSFCTNSPLTLVPVHYSPLTLVPVHYSPLTLVPIHYSPLTLVPIHYSPLTFVPVHYSPLTLVLIPSLSIDKGLPVELCTEPRPYSQGKAFSRCGLDKKGRSD